MTGNYGCLPVRGCHPRWLELLAGDLAASIVRAVPGSTPTSARISDTRCTPRINVPSRRGSGRNVGQDRLLRRLRRNIVARWPTRAGVIGVRRRHV
jgi:hypothetical protein